MSDWPLMIAVACGGALILFIGIMGIHDLDSVFLALSKVIDAIVGLFGGAQDIHLIQGGIPGGIQDIPLEHATKFIATEEIMMQEVK